MRKRIIIFAAAVLSAGLTSCVPKTEALQPSSSIEETGETEEGKTDAATDASEETAQISDELLKKVYEAVKEAYGEDYIPSMIFDETMLEGMLGITKDQYDACVAEGPMISAHVETFIGIKAKEGKTEEVAEKLNEYRDRLLEDSFQYPINMPKLEASQVITHGDYVFFVMLGSPDAEAEEQGEDAALESAKKKNQIAIDIISGFFEA